MRSIIVIAVAIVVVGSACSARNDPKTGETDSPERTDAAAVSDTGRADAASELASGQPPDGTGRASGHASSQTDDPLLADGIRSLKLKRSIVVRMEPHKDAERYGTIAAGTWVGWQRAIEAAPDSGCERRWIEIEPYGWICETMFRTSERLPKGVELPKLERAELVPGVYGKVIGEAPTTFVKEGEEDEIEMVPARELTGSIMVRRYGELIVAQAVTEPEPEGGDGGGTEGGDGQTSAAPETPASSGGDAAVTDESAPDGKPGASPDGPPPSEKADEKADEKAGEIPGETPGEEELEDVVYWRINTDRKAEYLPAKSIREYRPSAYRGLRLGDETGRSMPVGYPRSEKRLRGKIPVYSAARGGRRVDRIATRTPVPIVDIARDAKDRVIAYRIGEGRWVRARQMLLVDRMPPPPHTGAYERWFDLDLDTQVLVAYEGQLPVYTTMMATGSRKHPTGTGIFRIWVKFAEKNMSDLAGEDPYSVATVPWVQFYDKGLALHTSYWHDKFGTRRSHGCTNLAPADARFLYFWSDPQVPPGWSMAKGTVGHAGSMVRIRSSEDPDPQFQGYALEVLEKRKAQRESR